MGNSGQCVGSVATGRMYNNLLYLSIKCLIFTAYLFKKNNKNKKRIVNDLPVMNIT